jgi:putative ABC transport system permease protein
MNSGSGQGGRSGVPVRWLKASWRLPKTERAVTDETMHTWIKIAVRNLTLNLRRSVFTILAVAVGFAAVNVFGGFADYIFAGLRDGFIYAQGEGHLSIFKAGYLTEGKIDTARFLISAQEQTRIRRIAARHPEIEVVTAQLGISGLVSNGQISTITLIEGRSFADMQAMRARAGGMVGRLEFFTGAPLQDDVLHLGGLSSGLSEKIDSPIGSDVVLMAPTVEGQINALDMHVVQNFESPVQALNDMISLVTLDFVQALYDTDAVDTFSLLLSDTARTGAVKTALEKDFAADGLRLEVQTWEAMSPLYGKVKQMFDIIFAVLFVIVLAIVIMSIINTMSMAVMERTREIGTLRALGLKRTGVVRLFAIESALLGLLGSTLGALITLVAVWGIRLGKLSWIPPNFTTRVPVLVNLIPGDMLWTLAFMVALSITVAILPSRKAARMNIVDALGHA